MNSEQAIQFANLYKNTMVNDALHRPSANFAMVEVKGFYNRAAGGYADHRRSLSSFFYEAAERLQKSMSELFCDFASRYVRSKVADQSLNVPYKGLVAEYAASIIDPLEDHFVRDGPRNSMNKHAFKQLCSMWLELDFAAFASHLDKKYDATYLDEQLNHQYAQLLTEHLSLSHRSLTEKFQPYKAGRKLVESIYSEKNEFRTHLFGRELSYRQRDKLEALPRGLKRVADVMASSELNDAAIAMKLLYTTLERQSWYFDSRSKESFGVSTVTLFNEKFELSMSKEASTKLIVFLRKYGGTSLYDNRSGKN